MRTRVVERLTDDVFSAFFSEVEPGGYARIDLTTLRYKIGAKGYTGGISLTCKHCFLILSVTYAQVSFPAMGLISHGRCRHKLLMLPSILSTTVSR
jgi:hypothetical protein